MEKKATFEKLSASQLKMVTAAFAKKSNKELQDEIGELERTKAYALKHNPKLDPATSADLMELDYYIEIRKKALK